MKVVLAAPARVGLLLAPLIDCWSVSHTIIDDNNPPDAERLSSWATGADAVLVVASRRRSPRTVLPGPTVPDGTGRLVPVGWFPLLDDQVLRRFARAAAAVHARPLTRRSVVVLGQRLGRYDDLASRITRLLGEAPGMNVYRWTSYELHRTDLVAGLGRGPAAAIYVGHARPTGWAGYAGLRARHFETPSPAPVSAILSLTCHTASRWRTGLSFSEALVSRGACVAALGAVGPTLHTSNARWAFRVTAAARTATTLGELISTAAQVDPYADSYRIIGDPTAPLYDDPAFDPNGLEEVA